MIQGAELGARPGLFVNGEHLSLWRRRHGFKNQEVLASKLGVSWSTVHRWEAGAFVPSPVMEKALTDLVADAEKIHPSKVEFSYSSRDLVAV